MVFKLDLVSLLMIIHLVKFQTIHMMIAPGDTSTDVQQTINRIRMLGFEARSYRIPILEPDGPELQLYRIINPLADKRTLNKYPVLYGHGVLFDAFTMLSNSHNARPRKPLLGEPSILYGDSNASSSVVVPNDYSLPFMLANNNFDVWLFDARAANTKTGDLQGHNKIMESRKFWNFSLDEQALEDVPALINFVTTKTKAEKVIWNGFSETTLFMFALLSTKPEYADKLVAFVGMAPVTYMSYMRGTSLAFLIPSTFINSQLTPYQFVPQTSLDMINQFMRNLCNSKNRFSNTICRKLVAFANGQGNSMYDDDFLDHFYKTTSLTTVRHIAQILIRSRFAMYDFGRKENMKRYGRPNPPIYNLTRVKTDRLIIARGGKDKLATPEGQRRMLSELGCKPYLDIFIKDYSHFSFVDGKDLIRRVNEPIMRAIFRLMRKDGDSLVADLSFSFEKEDLLI